jgi:hypothetical protein
MVDNISSLISIWVYRNEIDLKVLPLVASVQFDR